MESQRGKSARMVLGVVAGGKMDKRGGEWRGTGENVIGELYGSSVGNDLDYNGRCQRFLSREVAQ